MKKAALVIIILALFVWATYGAVSSSIASLDWSALSKFSFVAFGLFALVSFCNFHLFSWRWGIILHAGREKMVSMWQLNMFRFVGYAVSYMTPFAQLGGEPIRMYFLEKSGFTRKESLTSVFIDKLFEGGIQLVFVTITLLLILTSGSDIPSETLTVTSIGLLGLLAIVYLGMTIWGNGFYAPLFRMLRLHKVERIASLEEKIIRTEGLIKTFFRGHTKDLILVSLLSVLTYVFFLGEYWVMLEFLGVHPTLRQLLIIAILPMVGYLTPIPGAVGAFEVLSITALTIAGVDPSLAIPIVAMIRLRDALFIAIGGLYASTHGVNLLRGTKV